MTEPTKRDLPTINPGWEERWENYRNYPDLVKVEITLTGEDFTEYELERTLVKFKLVEVFAAGLSREMIKGTIKYPHDRWDSNQWENAQREEEYSVINHRLLHEAEKQRRMQEAWEGMTKRMVELPQGSDPVRDLTARVIAPTHDPAVPDPDPDSDYDPHHPDVPAPGSLYLDPEQTAALLQELERLRQYPTTTSAANLHERIADMQQGGTRPDDLRHRRLAGEPDSSANGHCTHPWEDTGLTVCCKCTGGEIDLLEPCRSDIAPDCSPGETFWR